MRSGAIPDYAQWRDRSKPNLTTIKAVAAALQFDIWFVLHSLLPGLFGSGMTPIKKKKMPGGPGDFNRQERQAGEAEPGDKSFGLMWLEPHDTRTPMHIKNAATLAVLECVLAHGVIDWHS